MAEFGRIALTNTGINALVKAQAGNPLVFTKIKMGSGTYNGDVSTLTELLEVKLTAGIVNGTMLNNTYTVEAHFTNEGLATGFYWREIGLYIKDSSGNDALFGYANSGSTADYIPATASDIYTKHVRIAVAVGDVQNISVEFAAGTYVDVITFNESMNNKVDKKEGMGLSKNDYSDSEKAKVAQLQKDLSQSVQTLSENIKAVQDLLAKYATTKDLDDTKTSINNDIESLRKTLTNSINTISNGLTNTNNKVGTHDISDIGDGTLTGAILSMYNIITRMPALTSGTSEPSGGKSGDVYVMYEE